MAFTIKCNKCLNEQVFHRGDGRFKENIEIDAEQYGYEGAIRNLALYCKNDKCNHYIDIEF